MSKTTQQAFRDLKSSLSELKNDILDSVPRAIINLGNVVRKYRILSIVFYSLALYMIYIGEYPSAIISSILGIIAIR